MQYADKLHIPYVIFLGEDEVAAGTVSLKDLRSGEQITVPAADAAEPHSGRHRAARPGHHSEIKNFPERRKTNMMQSRTHTCGQLRIENAGEHVTLVGWMENVRVVGNNFAFIVLRDFYGTTQIVVETEEIMSQIKGINKESTISVTGTVRERASKNPKQPTGDIEVVPERIRAARPLPVQRAAVRDQPQPRRG